MRTVSFLIIALLYSTQAWTNEPAAQKPGFVTPPSVQITKTGHNRHPQFISNTSFIFVSKARRYHKDPQIYFHDLKKNKEKRITHQRGQLETGTVVPQEGKIIYSSTTDEDKETPYILKRYLERFPSSVKNDAFFQVDFSPQEIYSSKVDGTNVERLTEFSGFDGFPAYLPDKDRLYFSRWHQGQMSLFAKSLTKNLAPWKVNRTAGHDLGLQVSPNQNELVWYRFSPDFKTSQLLLSGINFKNPKFLTLESGVNWSPVWHPNGKSVIYSARAANMKDFDLFEVSIDGNCQRQITSYSGDEFFPAISPDGKTLLFTSTQSGHEQIHKLSYPGELSCQTEAQ